MFIICFGLYVVVGQLLGKGIYVIRYMSNSRGCAPVRYLLVSAFFLVIVFPFCIWVLYTPCFLFNAIFSVLADKKKFYFVWFIIWFAFSAHLTFFLMFYSDIERIYSCIWVRGSISNKPIFCSGNMLNYLCCTLCTNMKRYKDCRICLTG